MLKITLSAVTAWLFVLSLVAEPARAQPARVDRKSVV